MDTFDLDNVKTEKQDAVWRYNMKKRKLKNGLPLIGCFMVLFLLSGSLLFPALIPHTVEVVGNSRRRFIPSFNNPFFTFVLLNMIVVVVHVMSSQKQTQNKQTSTSTATHDIDMYHEYVSSRRSIPIVVPATEDSTVDKRVVLVENAVVVCPPVKQQCCNNNNSTIVETVTETKRCLSPVKRQPTTIRAVPGREFRRSNTEPPRKSMDEMSSEEFQLIIDSFIAEKKKSLMIENTTRKENCMSIVVKN